MAVENPSAGVISPEADVDRTSRRNHDSVTSHIIQRRPESASNTNQLTVWPGSIGSPRQEG